MLGPPHIIIWGAFWLFGLYLCLLTGVGVVVGGERNRTWVRKEPTLWEVSLQLPNSTRLSVIHLCSQSSQLNRSPLPSHIAGSSGALADEETFNATATSSSRLSKHSLSQGLLINRSLINAWRELQSSTSPDCAHPHHL